MSKFKITLTFEQINTGRTIAKQRQDEAIRNGRIPRALGPASNSVEALTMAVEGTIAELAGKLILDAFLEKPILWYSSDTYKFTNPDFEVGDLKIDTKSIKRYTDSLILRPTMVHDDWAYPLIMDECPTFYMLGWIWGREGKKEEYKRAPGGRPWAYFVPQVDLETKKPLLRSFESLLEEIRKRQK